MRYSAMSIQPNSDLLTVLRHNVRHLETNEDEGLSPEALEIRDLLLRRIAVIEAALARLSQFAAAGMRNEQRYDSRG